MLGNLFLLIFGFIFAGVGGETSLRGTVGLARWARVSPAIIGATVAAFASSCPDLMVAVVASVAGKPEMALGDALGGNILDVAFVIGLALLMGRLRCARHEIRRDFVVALLMRILIGVLALSGAITRVDGVVLLVIFFGWMVLISREAARQHSAAEIIQATQRRWLALLLSIVGFALLFAAGNLIVSGAQAIAFGWGVDTFIIGAVVVSIGTSIPEMAITLLAKYRGHDEVGVGTILGCNIYNGLLIVGTAAVIHPITIARQETLISIAFSLISLFLIWPTRQAVIPRWRGALLLALYAAYVVVLVGQAHRWQ